MLATLSWFNKQKHQKMTYSVANIASNVTYVTPFIEFMRKKNVLHNNPRMYEKTCEKFLHFSQNTWNSQILDGFLTSFFSLFLENKILHFPVSVMDV